MNMVQRLTLGVGSSLLFFAFMSMAKAESTPRFDGRTFGIELEGEYFSTDENLDGTTGERDSLGNGNTFETFTTKAKIDYSIKRNWLIGGGGEFVYAASSIYQPLTDETDNKSGTEFNTLNAYTQMQLKSGTFRIVPQAIGTFTIEKVNRSTNDVLTGEGTHQVEVGSWAMVDIALSEAYGYIGYRFQDDNRAHLLPWRIGDQFYIFRTVYTRVELGGHVPVKDDKYVNQRAYRTFVTNSVNGGSYRYYSVNPNLVEARIKAGVNASPEFELYGGLTHTLAGEAVAYGLSIYGGVRYSADIRKSVSPYSKDNKSYSDDINAEDVSEAEDAAATAREEREMNRAAKERTFRQRRRSQQFTPQLEDYNPKMFEKEMNKSKNQKAN